MNTSIFQVADLCFPTELAMTLAPWIFPCGEVNLMAVSYFSAFLQPFSFSSDEVL